MRRSLLSIAILISVCNTGCTSYEDPQQWKGRFYAHYPQLEKLVHRFQNNPHLDTLFHISVDSGLPDIAVTYPSVLKQL